MRRNTGIMCIVIVAVVFLSAIPWGKEATISSVLSALLACLMILTRDITKQRNGDERGSNGKHR